MDSFAVGLAGIHKLDESRGLERGTRSQDGLEFVGIFSHSLGDPKHLFDRVQGAMSGLFHLHDHITQAFAGIRDRLLGHFDQLRIGRDPGKRMVNLTRQVGELTQHGAGFCLVEFADQRLGACFVTGFERPAQLARGIQSLQRGHGANLDMSMVVHKLRAASSRCAQTFEDFLDLFLQRLRREGLYDVTVYTCLSRRHDLLAACFGGNQQYRQTSDQRIRTHGLQ